MSDAKPLTAEGEAFLRSHIWTIGGEYSDVYVRPLFATLDAERAKVRRLREDMERIHLALQTPSMPRQSIGEMVASTLKDTDDA